MNTSPIPPGPASAPWTAPQWPPPSWPPPAYPAHRPLLINWVVLIGAVLVLLGYLLFVISDALFLGLSANPTYGQFVGVYAIFLAGEALAGVGFFLALLGLAVRR